jgi:hypothetical protein
MSRFAYWSRTEPWLVFGLAAIVRLIHIEHPGFYDEFYHALAAQNFLEIADRPTITYRRAIIFTQIVAATISLFGDSLVAARLPSVFAGSALTTVGFLMGRRVAGPVAGRIIALLLCLDPLAILISQVSRFYSLQALAFLIGSLALYGVARAPLRSAATALSVIAAAACLALALALGYNVYIGAAGLGVWLVVDLGCHWWPRLSGSGRWASALGLLAILTMLYFVLPTSTLLRYYRGTTEFLAVYRKDTLYYTRFLMQSYPVLVACLPLALLAGLKRDRRFTFFAALLFGFALIVHSGAGRKQERYFFYSLPFMYAIVGVAAADWWESARRLGREVLKAIRSGRPAPSALSTGLGIPFAAIALLSLLFTNPGFQVTAGMLTASPESWPHSSRCSMFLTQTTWIYQPSDWEAAKPTLQDLADDADILVASAGIKALYYLGRLDYDLLSTLRTETRTGRGFDLDFRHGKPVISSPEAMARVVSENESGVVIIDRSHWRQEPFVPNATADFLEDRLQRVDVPKQWRLLIFRWSADAIGEEGPPRPNSG